MRPRSFTAAIAVLLTLSTALGSPAMAMLLSDEVAGVVYRVTCRASG